MTTKLNVRGDGPHAYSDQDEVRQPAIGEESGKLTSYDPDGSEEPLRRITIGEQGREVLAASIAGKDPEPLMNQWSQDIQEASEAPSP
jgi:hypothetical protein